MAMVPPPVRPPQSLARVAAAAPGLSLGNWAGCKFLWHSNRGYQSYRNCLQSLNGNWTQDCVCPGLTTTIPAPSLLRHVSDPLTPALAHIIGGLLGRRALIREGARVLFRCGRKRHGIPTNFLPIFIRRARSAPGCTFKHGMDTLSSLSWGG